MELGGTYEVGMSWVTSSANQASNSARWLGVISLKARPSRISDRNRPP
jgi:hypothetical protein